MSDNTAIGSALHAALDAATTASVYYGIAPQGGTPPYIIFQRQTGVQEYTFTSTSIRADYIVKAVSDRRWPEEAATLYDAVHTAIQGTVLGGTAGVGAWTPLRCQRQSTIEYREPAGYWHVGGVYRIDVHKSGV